MPVRPTLRCPADAPAGLTAGSPAYDVVNDLESLVAALPVERGAYNSGTTYVPNDLVESGGQLWINIATCTAVTPVEGGNWHAWTPFCVPMPMAVNTVAASSTAQTIPDVVTDQVSQITLTGNCTFTFPTAAAGKMFRLALTQDATGSRLATWPGTVKWPGGTAPTLTTTAAKTDLLEFICVDGTNWLGRAVAQNY